MYKKLRSELISACTKYQPSKDDLETKEIPENLMKNFAKQIFKKMKFCSFVEFMLETNEKNNHSLLCYLCGTIFGQMLLESYPEILKEIMIRNMDRFVKVMLEKDSRGFSAIFLLFLSHSGRCILKTHPEMLKEIMERDIDSFVEMMFKKYTNHLTVLSTLCTSPSGHEILNAHPEILKEIMKKDIDSFVEIMLQENCNDLPILYYLCCNYFKFNLLTTNSEIFQEIMRKDIDGFVRAMLKNDSKGSSTLSYLCASKFGCEIFKINPKILKKIMKKDMDGFVEVMLTKAPRDVSNLFYLGITPMGHEIFKAVPQMLAQIANNNLEGFVDEVILNKTNNGKSVLTYLCFTDFGLTLEPLKNLLCGSRKFVNYLINNYFHILQHIDERYHKVFTLELQEGKVFHERIEKKKIEDLKELRIKKNENVQHAINQELDLFDKMLGDDPLIEMEELSQDACFELSNLHFCNIDDKGIDNLDCSEENKDNIRKAKEYAFMAIQKTKTNAKERKLNIEMYEAFNRTFHDVEFDNHCSLMDEIEYTQGDPTKFKYVMNLEEKNIELKKKNLELMKEIKKLRKQTKDNKSIFYGRDNIKINSMVIDVRGIRQYTKDYNDEEKLLSPIEEEIEKTTTKRGRKVVSVNSGKKNLFNSSLDNNEDEYKSKKIKSHR